MLELTHISVCYGDAPALEDVSLPFLPGEVLAVIGPNGGGKSTLLKAACGLLPLAGGRVQIDGQDLGGMPPKAVARAVAYLPQSRPVPDITAERMVLHGRFPHLGWPRRFGRRDREIVQRALKAADAAELGGRSMQELSGGQRQKVYLAMALAQETETVLMDEPTTYLDIAHQLQLTRLARALADQGKAVVLVMHDLPLALCAADRIAVLSRGRLVRTGTPEEVYESGVIPEVFGVTLERIEAGGRIRYFCGGEV